VNTLGNAVHQRFSENDGANLYTSDVGINIIDPNNAEEETASVNYGQVLSGLLSLAVGGHFVTKQFTFVTPFSRSLIAIVASLFEETYITKPKTSRPVNSEVYLVGKWFKGISPELAKALLDRCEAYKTLNKLPTTWGSLLQPEVLAKVDADILVAAQEVHGEQQVAFLNEIAEAYRVSDGNKQKIVNIYEAKAQKAWLDENPLIVIATDDNLNHAKIEEAAMYIPRPTLGQEPPQGLESPEGQVQMQVQMTEGLEPLSPANEEEVSLLIPEAESAVETNAVEETDVGSGEKKVINFSA
jgi:hypothetical protein